jgi:hypothetical protein
VASGKSPFQEVTAEVKEHQKGQVGHYEKESCLVCRHPETIVDDPRVGSHEETQNDNAQKKLYD